MNCRTRTVLCYAAIFAAVSLSTMTHAQTTPFAKTQVADRIRKVEDGVDQFDKYLENRGEDAQSRANSAQTSGATTRRQQRSNSGNTPNSGEPSSREPSQANERRSRKRDGRSESCHEPSPAQVRWNLELSGDKGTNGAGHGQRAPRQSGDDQGELRQSGRTILDSFAREHQ